jgi:hypothetical protein
MIPMAIIACGRYDQSSLKKPFSMDALRVICQNVMLGNIVNPCNWRTFPMAFTTENGNIHFIGA